MTRSAALLGPLLLALAAPVAASAPIALVLHGGAGTLTPEALGPEKEAALRADLERALEAGHALLRGGRPAREAVIAAVTVLEDSPHFNAGKGAVFTFDGGHELDAAVMEGHTRRAGAVAAVRRVRNPIRLAEAVMLHSPHVMLSGEGAEQFAASLGLALVEPDWFDTELRRQQWQKARSVSAAPRAAPGAERYFGTVGAVALDREGHLAAATSTGGMTNKRWGRIGDTPIIGAGTFADEACAVSATGWGEFFIRLNVAADICARVRYRGDRLVDAAEEVVLRRVPELGGDGGIIALDREGRMTMTFNTPGMYRAWVRPDGTRGTAIFRDP